MTSAIMPRDASLSDSRCDIFQSISLKPPYITALSAWFSPSGGLWGGLLSADAGAGLGSVEGFLEDVLKGRRFVPPLGALVIPSTLPPLLNMVNKYLIMVLSQGSEF